MVIKQPADFVATAAVVVPEKNRKEKRNDWQLYSSILYSSAAHLVRILLLFETFLL